MTVDQLLPVLQSVRPMRGGYRALCPAHADTHPSLQVKAGTRGILLKCWSGCAVADICKALNIRQTDLFFDGSKAPDAETARRKHRSATATRLARGRRIDALREAERTIKAATGVDISAWPVDKLDAAIDAVGAALFAIQRSHA